MHLSKMVRSTFDPGVRRRGEGYVDTRVEKLTVHGDIAKATVAGSELYFVGIIFYPEISAVEWRCSCPFFEANGSLNPCKHIWAVLRRAENQGAFRVDPKSAESIDVIGDPSPEEDGDDDGFEPNSDEDGGVPFPFTPPHPISKWREVMANVKRATEHSSRTEPPVTGEILYLIDVPAALQGNGLTVQVLQRRKKRNGGWTKPKGLSLQSDQIARLPDPRDRHIMTLLHGASNAPDGYYAYGAKHVFQLTELLAPILLPLVAETGRLGLFRHQEDFDEPPRLCHDEGPPWIFSLEVHRHQESDDYVVEGALIRNDERLPLSAPVLLVSEGWVFTCESFAKLDHGEMLPWIAVLRRDGKVIIPLEDVDDWFSELLDSPRMPSVSLPPELRYETVHKAPKPVLKIVQPRSHEAGPYLASALSFDYGKAGCELNASDPRWFDPENRRLLLRDLPAEQVLVDRLLEAGFRLPRAGYGYFYKQPVHFEIAASKFPDAARTLIAEAWHIEASGKKCRIGGGITMNVRSNIDWFEVEGRASFDDVSVSFPAVLAAMKRGETTIVLGDGTVGVIPEQWLKRFSSLAGAATVKGDNARFTRSQVALLDALLAAETEVSCDEVFGRLRDELLTYSSVGPVEAPPGFVGTLRGYQREGLGWLHFLRRFSFGGCLADDMGLGKTVQALALLEGCRADGGATSLCVVPRSLVLNWMQEAGRFAPRLKVLNHTGPERGRTTDHLSEYDLVLTTYGTLRRDVTFLREFEFETIILDEAQAIKNANTTAAKAARLLKGRHRLAMSGTPIENHLGELWSLFEFLNPGMLGTASVFSAITSGTGVEIHEDMRELLSRALRPFILRRTKQQVAADLPVKTEETIYCELQPAQRRQYNELRDYYRQALLAKVDTTGLNKAKIMVLEALLRLRQAACHPGLLDPKKTGQGSAKLDLLLGQLEDVAAEGHKVLVFSQFTSMLAIVRSRLDARKIVYEYLDGKTRNRAERVERFQTDDACDVFLISLKAGGLGLNLTAADYVVLLDPWWNPAVEAQAIDRAHRIGQTRPVFAYRLVAKDTVEEHILELQTSKKALADSIITANNSLIRDLKREDLELLLT